MSIKSHAPTLGSNLNNIARDTERPITRRELLSALPVQGRATTNTAWSNRSYALRFPSSAFIQYGNASQKHSKIDVVLLLSGVYDTSDIAPYVPSPDETYADTAQKSVAGTIRITAGIWSATGTEIAQQTDLFDLKYPYAHSEGGSHYLLTQRFLLERAGNTRDRFVYREGLLDIPGTDAGCWEQKIITINMPDYDHRYPFAVRVDIQQIDDLVVLDSTARRAPGPFLTKAHVDILGFSAWGYS